MIESLRVSEGAHPHDDILAKLLEVRALFKKEDGKPLRIVGVGAGSWGSVFIAMMQAQFEEYIEQGELVDVAIWRREGKKLDQEYSEKLLDVINSDEAVLRRLRERGSYIKYVEARLGDRTMTSDEILRDGFCDNLLSSTLCPLKVVTDLEEAVYDADIVINSLPSTDCGKVFERISTIWSSRAPGRMPPVVVSLSKGVEFVEQPSPHIVTPTRIMHHATGIPLENLLYLGGPNIAAEVWEGEYATARLCGAKKWRVPLSKFFRTSSFVVVWDHHDVITHEVMGGLKNVYAIGMGIVEAGCKNSATSKSVYFSNACAEMVFITHLISPNPEYLAGPLLADTYVTLLKGRNAWYGNKLGLGEIKPSDGPNIKGKGLIQGVSAVAHFYDLLNSIEIPHPQTKQMVKPIDLLPTLAALNHILSGGGSVPLTPSKQATADADPANEGVAAAAIFVQAMRDEAATDPSKRLMLGKIMQGGLYNPALLGDRDDSDEDDDDEST